ncbi:MAG: 30S ribosome-binding factor RbfA [Bacteroidaceae bacterium]|nr:30S ribosome-binding factor RbfA [Bacteroidaceae bacterium]
MDSTRQNKISRLIQKELGDILLRLQKETRGIMVSVSAVRVSPDLGISKAYLSVFPSEKGAEVVNHLNENVKAIRFELGNRVRHQLRIIPEIRFYIDDSLDYIDNIDKLLKE